MYYALKWLTIGQSNEFSIIIIIIINVNVIIIGRIVFCRISTMFRGKMRSQTKK